MDFEVASFWLDSDLSYFNICAWNLSWITDNIHLFTKGSYDNIPEYVEHHDAGDIYLKSDIQNTDLRYSNGIYSDIWRVHLLQKPNLIWVDLDVHCLRPIDYEKEVYFRIDSKKETVNNCILKIPRHSIALHLLCNFLEVRVPILFLSHRELFMTFLDEELPSLNSWSGATPGPNALPSDRRKTGGNKRR